jgi:hypothetical protein
MDMLIVSLQGHVLKCEIARKRASKAGDFRSPEKGRPPRITVNGDLNQFAFLLTLIHEVAHFFVYLDTRKANTFLQRKRRPSPHGKEWKKRFTELMQPFLSLNVFPGEVETALISYFQDPKASSYADSRLQRLLQSFDPPSEQVPITEIPEGNLFRTASGRVFIRQERLRKRYRCTCKRTGRLYLFSPEAQVIPCHPDGQ